MSGSLVADHTLGSAVNRDTMLVIGSEKTVVQCHSTILKLHSEYFRQAFDSGGPESQKKRFTFPEDDVEGWLLIEKYYYDRESDFSLPECWKAIYIAYKYSFDAAFSRIQSVVQESSTSIVFEDCARLSGVGQESIVQELWASGLPFELSDLEFFVQHADLLEALREDERFLNGLRTHLPLRTVPNALALAQGCTEVAESGRPGRAQLRALKKSAS